MTTTQSTLKHPSRHNPPNCDFNGAQEFLQKHNSFLLASHARTDGDDLGSILALALILERMGKKAVLLASGGVPSSLKFLPKQNEVLEDVPEGTYDALILSGCKNVSRPGITKLEELNVPILNVDHHQDNTLYGDINLVDFHASCVGELLYYFFRHAGFTVDTPIAKCLLTGIFTDTGSFMHDNTSTHTLSTAGELVKHGARVNNIFKYTYGSKDLQTMRAWGKALECARTDTKNSFVISALTKEDMAELGQLGEGAFTGLVDVLNTLPGIKFALFMRQEGEIIKGSLRSSEKRGFDVFQIAKLLGGGGHKLASAFTLEGKLVKLPNGGWKALPLEK